MCRESRHNFALDFVLIMDTRNGLRDMAGEPQDAGRCHHNERCEFTSIDPLMYRIGSSNEGHRLQGLNQECKTLGFNSNDFCIWQDGNNGEDPRRCQQIASGGGASSHWTFIYAFNFSHTLCIAMRSASYQNPKFVKCLNQM
ncbi:hypothetical protein EJB05_43197 [Eragrostis curvula]|uniref:Uncharacterized protein n=1 Tax=Eragrostis curvula TaxID=38414 RepID=A0A5J9TEF0_9POAL|nr:hypothetical protein EJB05_43197 [Eragrostis curvula]